MDKPSGASMGRLDTPYIYYDCKAGEFRPELLEEFTLEIKHTFHTMRREGRDVEERGYDAFIQEVYIPVVCALAMIQDMDTTLDMAELSLKVCLTLYLRIKMLMRRSYLACTYAENGLAVQVASILTGITSGH